MKLSIVIPVYNEKENLVLLVQELNRIFSNRKDVESEFLFVDDGSEDDSLEYLRSLAQIDPRIRVVSFSRNFGSYVAVMAGLRYSTGDAVVNISADMQDPPDLINRLLEKWQNGYEVVWGYRATRDDPPLTTLFSTIYSWLMKRLALRQFPAGGVDVCLVDRKVAEVVSNIEEKNTSFVGLIMWSGFKQTFVPFHRQARQGGKTKWTLSRKIKLFIDSFVGFSFFPIRLISYIGAFLFITGIMALIILAYFNFFSYNSPSAWSFVLAVTVTLSGVHTMLLGILAEYVWRSLDQVRKRPLYIVKEMIGFRNLEN